MFGLEDSRRYYVCQRYVRMNTGINGLSKIVSNELNRPLLNGDVFIFFGKNRQTVKFLCWDGDGFLLVAFIADMVKAGEVPPVEFCEDRIKDIIISGMVAPAK